MTTRVGGISSGIDTKAIITALLDAEKQPITRWEDKIAEDQDKFTAWNSLDQKLTDVRSVVSDLQSYLTWNQFAATSSDEAVLTASAGISAQKGTYSIVVSTLAKAHRISSDAQTDTTSALGLSGDFTVGGQTVSVAAGDSLENIRDAINSAATSMSADAKVNASIIGTTLVIERDKTGNTNINISETGAANSVLRSLGVVQGTPGAPGTFSTVNHLLQSASDLSATINGVAYTGTSNTGVTDAVAGVTLNFKAESSATLTVDNDTDTIKSLLQDFVSKYNDAMALASTQGSVNLSDTGDINSYGVLQGDLLLSDIQISMRSILSGQITDPGVVEDQNYNSLYAVGVWFNSQENRLEIDEGKLDDALKNHLGDLEALLRGGETATSAGGIMRQVDGYMSELLDPVEGRLTTKEEALDGDIKALRQKISDKNSYLADYESSLWDHFAKMEDMVSGINSQWQYVQSSLGIS